MASVRKRRKKDGTPSYQIRVFLDENIYGKQHSKTMTWTPPVNMGEKAADKEAEKQAILFESRVQTGLTSFDSHTKFGQYLKTWIENEPLAPRTRERYWGLYDRINIALGHIRLEKLQAHHLEEFYRNLAEEGVNKRCEYAKSSVLAEIIRKEKWTRDSLGLAAGVSSASVSSAASGKQIRIETAEQIANALGKKVTDVFEIHLSDKPLSDKTILHHHRLICAALEKAKKERIVPFNVAKEHTTAPKVAHKEAVYMDDEEAKHFLSLVLQEKDVRIKTMLVMLLFTGVRRGELCGLSWSDINEKKQMVDIARASQYQSGKGVVEVPTKTTSSIRSIKVPALVIEILKEYRTWWETQKDVYGDAWKGEKERLFIQSDGSPINPDTINYWLKKFLHRHNLGHITPHSLRHTFATLQITAGVDIRTLQARTGHAQASTLVNIYSHAIRSAQESASEALESVLLSD